MRVRCKLFGCFLADDAPCCERCGTDLYEGFLERGWLSPLLERVASLRSWSLPRCSTCGRLLLFRKVVSEEFCSNECWRRWLPF